MNSIQISIAATEEEQEMLISELAELGAEGFEQTDTHLIAYFPELDFPSYDVQQSLGARPHTVVTLPERNWNEEWERNFHPVVVGSFCAVRADFHPAIEGVAHEIVITPKMSFGTGHHATTYMMMEAMGGLDFANKTVFDFGTGTGILAILAEKLGAHSIVAIDIDEWSVCNAEENLLRNGCRCVVVQQSVEIPPQSYDVILANINRNILLEYMERLKKALSPGGYILFSGLLTVDEAAINESASSVGLRQKKRSERNGWISLLYLNAL